MYLTSKDGASSIRGCLERRCLDSSEVGCGHLGGGLKVTKGAGATLGVTSNRFVVLTSRSSILRGSTLFRVIDLLGGGEGLSVMCASRSLAGGGKAGCLSPQFGPSFGVGFLHDVGCVYRVFLIEGAVLSGINNFEARFSNTRS